MDKVFGRRRRKGQKRQTTQRQPANPPARQERVRATMSRVPDEAVAQAASVPFVPSGGDQTGIVLQSVQVHLPQNLRGQGC